MTDRVFLAPGELRADLLRLFRDDCHHVDLMLAAPGLTAEFRGRDRVVDDPARTLSIDLAEAFRRTVLNGLAGELDRAPQIPEWEDVIHQWADALSSGGARVLHHVPHPLHTRLVSYPERTLVHPAPVTESTWRSDRELDLDLRGQPHAAAREWFRRYAEVADDISAEVRRLLLDSWAGEPVEPMDLYCKTLIDYFWTVIEGMDQEGDDNPMLAQLTDFQVKAYEYAKGILRRYGGVFLADVVGLGKTFIGMALLRHLQDRYDEHAVVIAPPNVCPAWTELASEYRVNLATVSMGKLDDLHRHADREIVLIDESHNFRNRGTRRYDTLDGWLRPDGSAAWRKVVLLSATPQNNDAADIKHQLAFFPDNHARLPYRGESLDDWFRLVKTGNSALFDLLQHVVVRRTRRFVKAAYPDARLRTRKAPGSYEEIPLAFPERVSGEEQCLRYAIDEAYGGGLYNRTLDVLERLTYAPYGLGLYVLPEHAGDPRVQGVRRAGRAIRGLYKVLVLKRLESSVAAFATTLRRLERKLEDALADLEAGQIRLASSHVDQGEDTSEDIPRDPRTTRDGVAPAALFDVPRLQQDLQLDLGRVRELRVDIEQVEPSADAKLRRLESWLKRRSPNSHRTIVFTQFADTAQYLGETLGQRFGRTAVVTGSTGNALQVARRFAPRANSASVSPEDEVDLLISTDALSEGVNLQDADTLVNYDLHWNPVRLIQRAGRIDRIGSTNDSIWIASFLPEAGLEAELRLEQVLRARSEDFIRVFGEDSDVLPSDEGLDDEVAIGAYTGAALEEADASDELDGLSRHIERLLRFRREDPERYNRCLAMRPGRRSVSRSPQTDLTATRVGWYWAFWRVGESGQLEAIQDQEGLDDLHRHATAGPADDLPGDWRERLGSLVESARERFAPDAAAFREQRVHPSMRPVEQWVLDQLHRYRNAALASELPLLGELEAWIREGHAKVQVARMGRAWRREKLSAESVFRELKPIFQRYPPIREALPDPETVFAVAGSARKAE